MPNDTPLFSTPKRPEQQPQYSLKGQPSGVTGLAIYDQDTLRSKDFDSVWGMAKLTSEFWKSAILEAFGKDYESDYLPPANEALAKVTGALGRDIALTGVSYGLTNIAARSLMGVTWLSKAASIAPKVVTEGAKGAAAGSIKYFLDKAVNPDEDTVSMAIDMAQYGGGDFARALTESLTSAIGLKGGVARLIETSADMLGGSLAALAIHGDVDQAVSEVVGRQAIAIGAIDLAVYYLSKSKTDAKLFSEALNVKKAVENQTISAEEGLIKLKELLKDKPDNWDLKALVVDLEGEIIQKSRSADVVENVKKFGEKKLKDTYVNVETKTLEETTKAVEEGLETGKFEQPKIETKPAEGGAVNTTRIDADDDVVNEINEAFEKVKQSKGDTSKTFEEIKEGAGVTKIQTAEEIVNELGLDLANIKTLNTLLKEAPEVVTKIRNSVVSLGYAIKTEARIIKKLKDAGQEIPPEQLAKLRYYIELQTAFINELEGVTGSVGRTLAAYKINVDGQFRDFSQLELKDMLKIADATAVVDANLKDAEGLAKMMELVDNIENFDTTADLVKFAKTSKIKKLSDAIIEYRTSNLLMNPNTHLRNILSQTAHFVHDTLKDYTAATINAIAKDPQGVTYSEATARFMGNLEGMIMAFKKPLVSVKDVYGTLHMAEAPSTIDIMRLYATNPKEIDKIRYYTQLSNRGVNERVARPKLTGMNILPESMQETPIGRIVSKVIDSFGSIQRTLSYGMLASSDKPFAYGAYVGEVRGQIDRIKRITGDLAGFKSDRELADAVLKYRQQQMYRPILKDLASQQGVPLDRLEDFIQSKFREMGIDAKFSDTQLKLIEEIDDKALLKSDEMTWKAPTETAFGKAFEQFVNKVPGLRLFIPFTHTPAKILEEFLYSSTLSKKFWEDLLHGTPEVKQRAAASLAVSASLYTTAALLYANGRLTPTARDSSERKRWQEAGIQENSIKVGDKWVNINTLDPAPAMYFTTTANVYRMLQEAFDTEDEEKQKTATQLAIQIMTIMAQNTVNKTWFTSVRDILNALTSEVGAEQFVQSFTRTLQPGYSLVMGYQQYFNDELIDIYGKVVKDKPVLDTFGKPISQYDYVLGLRVQEENKTSPIRNTLVDLGITLPRPSNSFDGVQLPDEEYYEVLRALDTVFHAEDILNELVTSDSFNYMKVNGELKPTPNWVKEQAIRKTWSKILERVKQYAKTMPSWKELYQQQIQNKFESSVDKQPPFIERRSDRLRQLLDSWKRGE